MMQLYMSLQCPSKSLNGGNYLCCIGKLASTLEDPKLTSYFSQPVTEQHEGMICLLAIDELHPEVLVRITCAWNEKSNKARVVDCTDHRVR